MRNAGLNEAQARIKVSRKNINNLRYADDTTLMAESEEELKRAKYTFFSITQSNFIKIDNMLNHKTNLITLLII